MRRGIVAWLLIMALETVHGAIRAALVAPVAGPGATERIGWPVGLVIVFAVTWLTSRWAGLQSTSDLLKLGAVWAVLTLAFEIFIGLLRGYDFGRIWAEIDPRGGGMLLASAIVMLLMPLIVVRLRGNG
jgi:hypothetical protein